MSDVDRYMQIEGAHRTELAKNEELGVELLTLVNTKRTLTAESEILHREREDLQKENARLTEGMSKYLLVALQ